MAHFQKELRIAYFGFRIEKDDLEYGHFTTVQPWILSSLWIIFLKKKKVVVINSFRVCIVVK